MVGRLVYRVVCVLTVLAVGASPTAAGESSGVYVSVGESSAAGPFIAVQLDPLGCFRSDHNYAHLAAEALGLTLRDPACSGAKIANMYVAQPVPFGGSNSPQIDAVTEDVTIVSVDFGVNDYADDGWTATALAPKISALLDDIRGRAPRAEIFVMGKIQRIRAGGCFPAVPLLPAQADQIFVGIEAVNAVLAARAAAHDAIFVDVYPASVGHDACAPEEIRWVEGIFPSSPAQPLHANAVGHQHEAQLLTAAIRDNS
ncbi:SGNH/GDSL hydrolase family protein [Nocardia ninae]|uniref:Hydrolase n=1 Tax=Nocardia ninae NBRC 108245 TaxID=1210091 RepID=A0A511MGE7_9NOCA|nr:SGNH/GDSL hydrolase family protein [Nocardia ninae]GEM39732.1 hydrolase [Nocardia ninae NBRC 108245]